MDVHSKETRSFNMSRIRDKDTKPEMAVRSLVHGMGYRYRLHRKDLPGKPDLVFRSRKKVIFVHGCFWHLHDCANGRVQPSTRSEFWAKKRGDTAKRDRRNVRQLEEMGWSVLTVWECEVRNAEKLRENLKAFLG